MARRWTPAEEDYYRRELRELYVAQNKTAGEIAKILGVWESTICKRLRRLGIPVVPQNKARYLNRRKDVTLPEEYSDDLAEFFGIMLGDGNLTADHVSVTLGNKEIMFANYVRMLMQKIFGPLPRIHINKKGYVTVYLCSAEIARWLKNEGMVYNKVKFQVDIPPWIFGKKSYMIRCARGFFDTDGSVYKLRYGMQLDFTNRSVPLLTSLQRLLKLLGYRVSEISADKFYITKISDVKYFFTEIQPRNEKHLKRYEIILGLYQQSRAGIEVAKRDAL